MYSTFLIAIVSLLAVPAHSANFMVTVGQNGKFAFNPQTLTDVNAGDSVEFMFYPPVHSATQSSFSNPCVATSGGFDSGLISSSDFNNPITKNWTVPDGNGPWWFFCKQPGHCGMGMVFAVNPTDNETFTTFQNTAQGKSSSPGTSSTSSTSPSPTGGDTPAGNGALPFGGVSPLAWPLLLYILATITL
ncbi:hypothetical protein CVT26_005185 [Gymnopilus dilepis]|uniref:Phytocyanin domain-containing protein n=1 Tax=Gymnopilus dilepis TaxID=231916 RepID=A0A409W8M1_9AGAR|nr:hypothetical protein CVT26_005185 [Gymnopilus dilepis]